MSQILIACSLVPGGRSAGLTQGSVEQAGDMQLDRRGHMEEMDRGRPKRAVWADGISQKNGGTKEADRATCRAGGSPLLLAAYFYYSCELPGSGQSSFTKMSVILRSRESWQLSKTSSKERDKDPAGIVPPAVRGATLSTCSMDQGYSLQRAPPGKLGKWLGKIQYLLMERILLRTSKHRPEPSPTLRRN